MNFVLICIDTLRYDHLSCHGNDWIKTPNLEAFAQESVIFDNAYVGSYATIPHRTDVMKGSFGTPLHPWLPLGFDDPRLPEVLGKAGWATALICDTPHLINGAHGFDHPFHAWHFERGSEVDRHIIDDYGPDRDDKYSKHYSKHVRACTLPQYVRNNRDRRLEEDWSSPRTFKAAGDFVEMNTRREKFFLWVDTFATHEPWEPPEHYVALYDDPQFDPNCKLMGWEPLEMLSPDELRHVKAHYAGEVTMLDHNLGRFLDRLTNSGRDRDTVVIVTTDHGVNLGAHGIMGKTGTLYEQIAHEVMIVRAPGARPGRRSGIVQPADIMPTILELAEVDVPEECQGRSFASMITGEHDDGRKVAVSGVAINVAGAEKGELVVQDQRWCLIDRTDPSQRELYDKESDRAEVHNVIHQHPQEAERLHRMLTDFLNEHAAHNALVEWFQTGVKGNTSDYRHVPDYLKNFQHYWKGSLNVDVHKY